MNMHALITRTYNHPWTRYHVIMIQLCSLAYLEVDPCHNPAPYPPCSSAPPGRQSKFQCVIQHSPFHWRHETQRRNTVRHIHHQHCAVSQATSMSISSTPHSSPCAGAVVPVLDECSQARPSMSLIIITPWVCTCTHLHVVHACICMHIACRQGSQDMSGSESESSFGSDTGDMFALSLSR